MKTNLLKKMGASIVAAIMTVSMVGSIQSFAADNQNGVWVISKEKQNGSRTIKYEYDENANLIKETLDDYLDGKSTTLYENELDDLGRVVKRTGYNNDMIVCIYEYTYYESGQIKKEVITRPNGTENGSVKEYEYDEYGKKKVAMEHGTTYLYEYEYYYDTDNRVIKEEVYYVNGENKSLSSYWIYTYKNDLLVSKKEYHSDGTTDPATGLYKFSYDEDGNLTESRYYEWNGYLIRTEYYEFIPLKNDNSSGDSFDFTAYGLSDKYVPEDYEDNSGSAMIIEEKDLSWNTSNGKSYWYEKGIKQGTYYDPKGVIGDGTNRGREICDNSIKDANGNGTWFWLDACYDGAKAVGKEVWVPYIYQDEDKWDDARKKEIAYESDPGMEDLVYRFMKEKNGKWVRYDDQGRMCKGWVTIEGALAEKYPDQVGNTYYYDTRTGLMAKGKITIDGVEHFFDETTGVKQY